MHSIEAQFARLLTRLVPGIEQGWLGAAPDQIAEIEVIAGRPLPNFYRWFLATMGQDMGALSFATMDFSAARVLEFYREEFDEAVSRYLLIGYQNDPMVPMHTWYDLDSPQRDDALVLEREIEGGLTQVNFETFCELLAWKAMLNFRIDTLPNRVKGKLRSDGPDVRARLDRAVDALNFDRPLSTGPCCGIFDRADAALVCRVAPDSRFPSRFYFHVAANNEGILRRILGVITKESGLTVEVDAPRP
jgi:hypothetical protein